jgi:hypothetical protein
MEGMHRRTAPCNRERGSVVVLVAVFLAALLGFAALSLDLARAVVVRNELQNAADAAALAGAGSLVLPGLGSPSPTYVSPNWAQAEADGVSAITLNSSEGVTLKDVQVQTGYWNVSGSPPGLQAATITPGAYDKPAVSVTVSRSTGNNGGPLKTFFGPLLGFPNISLAATAVAVLATPGSADPASMFPMAITQCLINYYFNSRTGQPVTDPSTGKPYIVTIDSSYHDSRSPCNSGQWTSFQTDSNNVPAIRDLIANGNPADMNIGDKTWIEPGTKTTLYSSVRVPSDVVFPVVTDISTHAAVPIVGFASFHITASVGGSGKYIRGYFTTDFKAAGMHPGGGSGPYYGSYVPPVLVQ